MNRNVGRRARRIRGSVGIVLLLGAIGAFLDGDRTNASVLALAGSGLLFNWRTGFCGGNALLGRDTTAECSTQQRGRR